MRLVIDMNLSPAWAPVLERAGHNATHWTTVGAPNAHDREILQWAKAHDRVLFTHDLDFGAILAATGTDAPGVLQIRTEDPTPDHCAQLVLSVLRRHAEALSAGALVSVNEARARVRILPLSSTED